MTIKDLVVVIPGIMGSTLAKDGKPFWSNKIGPMTSSILHLSRNIDYLRVPAGLCDDHPNDGVDAVDLMGNIHLVPGLWSPVQGYGALVTRLERIGFHRALGGESSASNLVLFPYDWRLSNRYNARRLKTVVETSLGRWREASPNNREAKVIFICHSMGGLVARWYIAVEGGAEVTRKLITLGTPFRGSLKAVATLANGPLPALGRVGVDLHSAVAHLPSAHQLLPSYACLDRGGVLKTIEGHDLPGVPSNAIDDGMAFYRELEKAEQEPGTNPMVHAIIGTKQSTLASISVHGDTFAVHDLIDGTDHGGDGTVSAASIPKGRQLDDNTLRRVAEKHGSLQVNRAALDEIEQIITSQPVTFKTAVSTEIAVSVPEIVNASEPIALGISCTVWPRAVIVSVTDEQGRTHSQSNKVIRENTQIVKLAGLPPGGHIIRVWAANNMKESAVSSPVLVWPTS